MPVDENTRLRIRQYLIELMDEGAADAMMESMPPIPWTELATKDDITRLDGQLVGIDGRLDSLTVRVDQTSSNLQELTRVVAQQGASLGTRMDSIADRLDGTNDRIDSTNERIDSTNEQFGDLSRTVTVGFFSMALTLAVFMIGTLASLFAAGAFG